MDKSVAERHAAPLNVQVSGESMQSTAVITPRRPPSGDPLIERSTPVGPVADSQTDMSRFLDRAEEAMDTVRTWKSAVKAIKHVMDVVGPIMKVWHASLFSTLH